MDFKKTLITKKKYETKFIGILASKIEQSKNLKLQNFIFTNLLDGKDKINIYSEKSNENDLEKFNEILKFINTLEKKFVQIEKAVENLFSYQPELVNKIKKSYKKK